MTVQNYNGYAIFMKFPKYLFLYYGCCYNHNSTNEFQTPLT